MSDTIKPSDIPVLGDDLPPETREQLQRELRKQSRDPFRRALTRLLATRPDYAALQAFANKHPDKWASAVAALAPLAGFEKGINVTLHVKPVEQMSDQELLEEYLQTQARVAALARGAVEGEVVDAQIIQQLPLPANKGGKDE